MTVAVLYRWRVKPGMEKQFRTGWVSGTRAIHAQCGSYGAALHDGGDGIFWAYARWPDDATRKACFSDGAIFSAPGFSTMHKATAETLDEVVLQVLDDLLDKQAFASTDNC